MSGTAVADLAASIGGPAANLSVTIVDYGAGTQTSRTSDGVTLATTASCWGVGTAGDPCEGKALGAACTPTDDDIPAQQAIEDACYLEPGQADPGRHVVAGHARHPRHAEPQLAVVRRRSPLSPVGTPFRLQFPTMPNEHMFKAGHQIGIIVGGTNTSMVSGTSQPNNVAVTLDARTSKVSLPIIGGAAALNAAGAFTDASGSAGGTVPATLALTLGAPASFGAFTPGVARSTRRRRRPPSSPPPVTRR